MSFLTPLFLLGGLAIALPVVFHLVRRSSRERQVFSSLMFLRSTPPRMTRRNRLEHIFLLLLRCLAICLLALGFARPFLRQATDAAPSAAGGSQTVLLVDNSASMKRDGVWSDAVARAEAVLKEAGVADQVAVLMFDNRARTLVSFEQWTEMNLSERVEFAVSTLRGGEPSWRSTHLDNALITAAEALADLETLEHSAMQRRIVVITDLQEGARVDALQGQEWPAGLEVVVERVEPKRPTNAGLQWVMAVDESSETSADDGIRIRVSNSANATREQFQVQWEGVTGAASLDAYVPPGQSRIMAPPELPANAVGERIVLTGDDGDFDNTVYVVQPSPAQVNVLYLGDDREDDPAELLYYLKRAFQDTRRQTVRLLTDGARQESSGGADVPAPDVGGYRLVIVSAQLAEDRAGEVREFLNGGGTALVVMPDARTAGMVHRLADAAGVQATEAEVSDYAMFGEMDFSHPLLAPFSDPRYGDFTKVRFWKHRRLDLEGLADARVLVRFDNDVPAILEIPVGRGRMFVFTFSWKPADSQLALSSKFVPMLYSMLDQAGGPGGPLAQFRVGEVVDLSAVARSMGRNAGGESLSTADGGTLSVEAPDGSVVQLKAEDPRFEETDQPGIYEVRGASTAVRFAVNVDAAESRTALRPVEELERLGVPMEAGEVVSATGLAKAERLHSEELEARQKLWRWLIVAAVAVLLFETWLAGRITRRPALTVEAAT